MVPGQCRNWDNTWAVLFSGSCGPSPKVRTKMDLPPNVTGPIFHGQQPPRLAFQVWETPTVATCTWMVHASLRVNPCCRKIIEQGASVLATCCCIIHCNDSLLQRLLLEAVAAAGGYRKPEWQYNEEKALFLYSFLRKKTTSWQKIPIWQNISDVKLSCYGAYVMM